MRAYTLYRLECGLRSSAVLGFIGLPTLGFQLDTFFKQGAYGAVAAVLLIYYALIAGIGFWARPRLLGLYLAASLLLLGLHHGPPGAPGGFVTLITHDLVPAPLRQASLLDAATWSAFAGWLNTLVATQAVPGAWATLVVGQITLALMGVLALAFAPLIVPRLSGRFGSLIGHLGLVVGRSTPEYMLAFLLLQIFGPSMLPAILALALHNAAIIGHLVGRQADVMTRDLRPDAPSGLNLYGYELLPRLYGGFLALCLYRWEIVLRESAILGILGIQTLGFFIDSAIAELRLGPGARADRDHRAADAGCRQGLSRAPRRSSAQIRCRPLLSQKRLPPRELDGSGDRAANADLSPCRAAALA
jgi:phosphonate transport system permease protein